MARSRTTLEPDLEASAEGFVRTDGDAAAAEQSRPKRNRNPVRATAPVSPRRTLLVGLILAFFMVVFIAAVALAYQVDTFLATDSRFALRALARDGEVVAASPLEITGLQYADRRKVLRRFEQDVGLSLYLLPLHTRKAELKDIDWVEDASVSRVWPNRLRVAIRERTPVAMIAIPGAKRTDPLVTKLADASGALMSVPKQAHFDLPVVFGLHDAQPRDFRKKRIELLLQLQREVAPLNARFSELFLGDPRNLRATLVMDGRSLTLILGGEKYLTRVRNFLSNYEVVIKEDPGANLFDMRLEDRILATREGLSGV